jgi:hypothetical protein
MTTEAMTGRSTEPGGGMAWFRVAAGVVAILIATGIGLVSVGGFAPGGEVD